jgi:hypothetical protein
MAKLRLGQLLRESTTLIALNINEHEILVPGMHTSILTQPNLEQSCPFFTQTDSRLVNALFSAPWMTVKSFRYLGGSRLVYLAGLY